MVSGYRKAAMAARASRNREKSLRQMRLTGRNVKNYSG
jgi:hypothetical protein